MSRAVPSIRRRTRLPGRRRRDDTSALHQKLVEVLGPRDSSRSTLPDAVTEAESRLRLEHAGKRILLVEDNAVKQEVAHGLLTAVGLRVELT